MFAIDPAHQEAIIKFVSEKALEDGIIEQNEMLSLIFEYWDIVKDPVLVAKEADLIEAGRLKSDVTNRQAQLDQINSDIAVVEARGDTRDTTPKPPPRNGGSTPTPRGIT